MPRQDIDALTAQAIKDFSRAVERDVGPSVPKEAFDPVLLAKVVPDALAKSFACAFPKHVAFLGTVFLTRGIEAGAARAADLVVSVSPSSIGWRIPASKTDTKALGEAMHHSCWCADAAPWCDLCPFHVALDIKEKVAAMFPDADPAVLPLFPSKSGATLSRAQTVAAIRAVVAGSGQETSVELVHAGCSETRERFSEHSMRVPGA